MAKPWNVLIVDDEPDVHTVTKMALRRRTWRGRPFNLLHALSGKEAREVLLKPETPPIQVALVDVVMESEHAGLDLCEFIREHMPVSLRIVLRTGQPGSAPEESVMNKYDIDYYLAKADVTEERLYMALRASSRSSIDLATQLMSSSQLHELVEALQVATTDLPDLLRIMYGSLAFLEDKHDIQLVFVDRAEGAGQDPQIVEAAKRADVDLGKIGAALTAVAGMAGEPSVIGDRVGLSDSELVVSVRRLEASAKVAPSGSALSRVVRFVLGSDPTAQQQLEQVCGGMYVKRREGSFTPKEVKDITRDLSLLGENWRVASALLSLRERTVHDRMAALEAAGSGA